MRERDPRAPVLAGGTDLLARSRVEQWPGTSIILLTSIPELGLIESRKGAIRIGACVTHTSISRATIIRSRIPALASAAESIGAPAIRNMGTIGGNLVNASPAADLPPALLALGASVRLISTRGERDVPLEHFYTSYQKTVLAADEILSHVIIRIPEDDSESRFYKIGTRKAQSIAKVSVAGAVRIRKKVRGIRMAAGSVAEIPIRLRESEAVLLGREPTDELMALAAIRARESVHPIDDVRSTATYRSHVLQVLVRRFLEDVARRRT